MAARRPLSSFARRLFSSQGSQIGGADAFLSATSRGSWAFHNGQWKKHEECYITLEDQSYRYGYGAFDTLRTFNGKLFRAMSHVRRFQKTLKAVSLPRPYSDKEWIDLLEECVLRNEHIREKWGGDHWVSVRVSPNSTVVEAQPIPFASRAKLYRDGARVAFPSIRRTPPECLPPRAKLHQYVNQILGDLEGKSYNFFIVTEEGTIKTARSQFVLEGVARDTILECARSLGIKAEECDYDIHDVYQASEAFISATSLCVLPVRSVNGKTLSAGCPGPIVQKLQAAYSARVGMTDFTHQYLKHL
ncbi:hypothetical protein AAMO2058_001343300 [Amorphochlora amoebiformis]